MFVCICNRYRDRDLEAVAATGVHCAREAYGRLGHPPVCGCCLDMAQQLIDAYHDTGAATGDCTASSATAPA